jgi:cytidine deaminase
MPEISEKKLNSLVSAARAVQVNAHAPYSEFKVGAALLSGSGKIYTGVNVENSSYPVSICAERHALGTAVAAGERSFIAICIVSDSTEPVPPCGACRQALSEFCDDLFIVSVTLSGISREFSLKNLLPDRFHKEMFFRK